MPLKMTYDDWMKRTYSRIAQRSDDLKKIDEAIKMRNAEAAKTALIKWIDGQNAKHQDWHRSVRNENHAVEELYKELGILGPAASNSFSAEIADKAAKVQIRRDQQLAAARMFTGKQIQFKERYLTICRARCRAEDSKLKRGLAKTASVGGTAANLAGAANSIRGIASSLETVIKTIMGEALSSATRDEIVKIIFGTTIEEFVHNAAPFLGFFTSGAKAVLAWVGVARNLNDAIEMEARYGDVRAGDAAAALHAMVEIIDKEIHKQTADAIIRTTAFTAKGIGLVADGGAATTSAIGAVESIAIILNTLADVVKDARQKEAGNKLIATGHIDVEIFSKCPILGCYYIAVQDHSTIMNFEIANMGKENWHQEAERLKYAIEPVIKKAAELIEKSRMEIPGMEAAKGIYQSSLLQKINLYYKSKGYGQDKQMASISSDVFDIFEPS